MINPCLPGLDLPVPLDDSVLTQSQLADLVWICESYSSSADRWFYLKLRKEEVGFLLSMLHDLFGSVESVGKTPRGRARGNSDSPLGNSDSPLCAFMLAAMIDSLETQLLIDAEIARLPVDDC